MPNISKEVVILDQKTSDLANKQLAEHLKQAEHHLIEAINLFSGEKGPVRGIGYYRRLGGAQEAVTALHREELVRMRGPQRPVKGKKR